MVHSKKILTIQQGKHWGVSSVGNLWQASKRFSCLFACKLNEITCSCSPHCHKSGKQDLHDKCIVKCPAIIQSVWQRTRSLPDKMSGEAKMNFVYSECRWNFMRVYERESKCGHYSMRNRHPHRENVENILAISLPIITVQHIRESPSVSHAMRKSAWND